MWARRLAEDQATPNAAAGRLRVAPVLPPDICECEGRAAKLKLALPKSILVYANFGRCAPITDSTSGLRVRPERIEIHHDRAAHRDDLRTAVAVWLAILITLPWCTACVRPDGVSESRDATKVADPHRA